MYKTNMNFFSTDMPLYSLYGENSNDVILYKVNTEQDGRAGCCNTGLQSTRYVTRQPQRCTRHKQLLRLGVNPIGYR